MTELFAMTELQESQGRKPEPAPATTGDGSAPPAGQPSPAPAAPVATAPAPLSVSPTTPIAAIDKQILFFNRELSWLNFNRRVLEESLDETNPVLERVKFLAIA